MTIPRLMKAACLALTVLVSACATPDPAVTLPGVTFQHLPPMNLAVSGIETVQQYASPLKAPHVDHKMDTPPAQGLATWTGDRLKAVGAGTAPRARMIIEKASLTETPLKRTEGIKGAFTTDQSHRYDLNLQATLEIIDSRGIRLGHTMTQVSRNQTMPEDASLNDLHRAWFDLMELGLHDFNREMEANMRRFLADWIR